MFTQNKQGAMDKFVGGGHNENKYSYIAGNTEEDNPGNTIITGFVADNDVRIKNLKAKIDNATPENIQQILDDLIFQKQRI